MEKLNLAYQVIASLRNEDCFDFFEVASSNFEEKKSYLKDMIFEYFRSGETNLCGLIQRVDSDDYIYEGTSTPETVENINQFFSDKELVDDIILLMDEDLFVEFENELSNE